MDKIIAACGLVCSECDAYQATQANDAEKIARTAAHWSQVHGGDIKPESVWCDGCLTGGARKCGWAKECPIRACAVGRAVENCARCEDYGCEKLASFHNQVPQAREVLETVRRTAG